MTGFEPLIAAATAGLTGLVTEIIKGQGGNALTQLLSRDIGNDVQQTIFNASQAYITNYTKRHGILKVLGMREPVSLDSIYTNVQFLDEEEVQRFCSIQDLEKDFRSTQTQRFYGNSKKRVDGVEVVNKNQYLMLLGSPGSGKSTFIRKIGLEALKGKQGGISHRLIPVFLELKRFTESKVDLKEIITNEFEICGFPSAKEFTKKALEKGKLLILLDGIDEVPTVNLNQVIEAIQDFVDQHHKNHYITSCRIAAYRHNFRRFTDVVIAEFDNKQIEQFINRWFQSEEDKKSKTAQKCWELLNKPENIAAKELAHTPLLLTFLCLVYNRSQTFLNNRSTLYNKALRILMEEWAAEKRILQQEIYQGLNTELEEVLLSEIAYKSFEVDRLFLPQTEIVQQIKTFLSSNLNAPTHLSGEEILDAIVVQQGIFVERAEAIYSFSHLTLQEYLTAKYIHDHRKVKEITSQHLTKERWREVFLLTAGLMVTGNGADELLLEMSQVSLKDITSIPKIINIFHIINQIAEDIAIDVDLVTKRALATHVFIRFINNINGKIVNGKVEDTIRWGSINLNFFIHYDNHQEIISDELGIISFNRIAESQSIYNSLVFDFSKNGTLTILSLGVDFIEFIEEPGDLENDDTEPSVVIENDDDIILSSLSSLLKHLGINVKRDMRMYISSRSLGVIIDQTSINKFANVQCKTYNLDRKILMLSSKEIEILSTYLSATILLMRCKESAARISPDAWKSIKDKIFLF